MQNRQGWNRRITRRQLTRLSLAGLGSAMITSATAAMGRAAPDSEFDKSEFDKSKFGQPVNAKRPKILGTTFSPLQCHYIGLDYQETFRWVCGLGLDRIRLCAYWHEIEPRPNQFDFSVLDRLLEECDRYGIEAILAVGMKVPRWPEFHFPDWLQAQYNTKGRPEPMDRDREIAELTLRFTEKVVSHTRMAPALKYWQVENEPFTHLEITGGRYLSTEFVQQEVALVRALARADQKNCTDGGDRAAWSLESGRRSRLSGLFAHG
jgi:beta-glucosidase/6-phospho-beta-glucosidase/beta-galactosidase